MRVYESEDIGGKAGTMDLTAAAGLDFKSNVC